MRGCIVYEIVLEIEFETPHHFKLNFKQTDTSKIGRVMQDGSGGSEDE
jgi:hypothetical protein